MDTLIDLRVIPAALLILAWCAMLPFTTYPASERYVDLNELERMQNIYKKIGV